MAPLATVYSVKAFIVPDVVVVVVAVVVFVVFVVVVVIFAVDTIVVDKELTVNLV